MRIFISGGGDTAYELARRFSKSQEDVVVVVGEGEQAAGFDSLDIQVLSGNPADAGVLRQAGVEAGDPFIACGESDELNIISSLAAKKIGDARTFCFVSQQEYYRGLSRHEGNEPLLDIDHVLWPQQMLAEEIARIVVVPRAIDVEIFAGGEIWLVEYRLRERSPLVGDPLAELGLPRGVLAVAVIRDDGVSIPSGSTELRAGDKIVFMGQRKLLREFVRKYIVEAGRDVRDVAIVGGGNVGVTLTRFLEQEERLNLKVLERSRERCEEIAAQVDEALVIHGDGTDLELLEAEHLDETHVLVAVTSDDQTNLLTSLLGRRMGIPKVITRVNKTANVRLFEGVGIDVPLNPRSTAINAVLNLLQPAEFRVLAVIEQGRGEVLEIDVPEDYGSRRLRDLPRIQGAIVGAILRGPEARVPHGDDVIGPGDRLLVFSTREGAEALRDELRRDRS